MSTQDWTDVHEDIAGTGLWSERAPAVPGVCLSFVRNDLALLDVSSGWSEHGMSNWFRRFGRGILAGSEAVLAASGLVTIWMLTDISRGVEHGAYDPEAASGFATAFLALWVLSFLVLGLVLAIDGAVWALRILGDDGFDDLHDRLLRIGLELSVAALLSVVALNVGTASSPFDFLLAITASLGVWVLLHHTANAIGTVRRRVAST